MRLENWKLSLIQVDLEPIRPLVKVVHRNDAYILNFINDVSFELNTSVNLAKGNYSLINENQIIFSDYHEETLVGELASTSLIINNTLLTRLRGVYSYEILDDCLILLGSDIRFEFRRI